jgi:hypothetical protein
MKTSPAVVTRIRDCGGIPVAEVECEQELVLAPGQYLAVPDPGDPSGIPGTFFPLHFFGRSIQLQPAPAHWLPGHRLNLRGAYGRGFQTAGKVRKMCLISWSANPGRLMPVLTLALQAGIEVILLQDGPSPFEIPSAVEIMPLDQFGEATSWADWIGMDCTLADLPRLKPHFGLLAGRRKECPVQVLVAVDMPCLGIAECGICAVHTHRGYQLACKHGPVFDFFDLLLD